MTSKDYCSKICKARCCKKRPPLISPSQCPMLGPDDLCTIYADRVGFTFPGRTGDGKLQLCRCRTIEDALPMFPGEMRDQCCYWNRGLLKDL